MKISSLFKPLSFLPALALMYMIYSFSAQPADSSSSTSYYVSTKLVQAANTITGQGWDDWEVGARASQIHGIVRKAAHITEYFLLAIAVSFPLYVYGVRGIFLMLLAGIICVGYACGDEYHQSIVSGRSASSRDVMIDSIGIFFGIQLRKSTAEKEIGSAEEEAKKIVGCTGRRTAAKGGSASARGISLPERTFYVPQAGLSFSCSARQAEPRRESAFRQFQRFVPGTVSRCSQGRSHRQNTRDRYPA